MMLSSGDGYSVSRRESISTKLSSEPWMLLSPKNSITNSSFPSSPKIILLRVSINSRCYSPLAFAPYITIETVRWMAFPRRT